MSEAKTFQQVIEGWRHVAKNRKSDSPSYCALASCADEASLVLAALRVQTAEWRAKSEKLDKEDIEGDERTAMANVYDECADALEQIIGP